MPKLGISMTGLVLVAMACLRMAVMILQVVLSHITVWIPRCRLLILVRVQAPPDVARIRRLVVVMARVILVLMMRRRVLLVVMLVRLALIALMFIFVCVTSISDKQSDADNDQNTLHGFFGCEKKLYWTDEFSSFSFFTLN
jgi:hypothetical protein